MIAVDEALTSRGLRGRMILTVHDELVFDCPGEELEALLGLVVPAMEGAMDLDVPLKVETGSGPNWSEAH
jgi:DNA polymerase-1